MALPVGFWLTWLCCNSVRMRSIMYPSFLCPHGSAATLCVCDPSCVQAYVVLQAVQSWHTLFMLPRHGVHVALPFNADPLHDEGLYGSAGRAVPHSLFRDPYCSATPCVHANPHGPGNPRPRLAQRTHTFVYRGSTFRWGTTTKWGVILWSSPMCDLRTAHTSPPPCRIVVQLRTPHPISSPSGFCSAAHTVHLYILILSVHWYISFESVSHLYFMYITFFPQKFCREKIGNEMYL